jgi:hypothetical protein
MAAFPGSDSGGGGSNSPDTGIPDLRLAEPGVNIPDAGSPSPLGGDTAAGCRRF